MAITESRISHSEHLLRGAIDELHSHPRGQGDSIPLVVANLWTRLPGARGSDRAVNGLVAIAIGLRPGALM